MVLEATILLLDNSDWARNGDYEPSRWETQINAANLIIENRCDKNPENALGVITMAGKRVEVHSTLTNEESRILHALSNIDLSNECDVVTALNISTLTLKHRMNKNQKQRIILFIGSPIKHTPHDLETTGKKLKKYNISVDIISFGHTEQNRECLTAFLNSVNNAGSSSLIEVPVGGYIVECLLNSAVLGEGFDQQIEQGGNNNGGGRPQEGVGLSQFERDLNLAMQMSLQESNKDNKQNDGKGTGTDKGGMEEFNEEEELEKARLLSLQENANVMKKKNEEKEKEFRSEALESPDFIKGILEEVTSDKVKDEEVKDILEQIKSDKAKQEDKEKKDKEKEKDKEKDKKEEPKDKKDDKMDIDKQG